MDYRIEHDSMGEVKVPADKLWGAQTQRSFQNFEIGDEKIPAEVITAFSYLKEAAALANFRLGVLDEKKEKLISTVCEEIRAGKLQGNFPLAVWQTGSGTQSNMNVNEVIANRGNEIAGEKLLHPNDDCNKSQSSNDTFPTAMHIAAVLTLEEQLIPSLEALIQCFRELETRYKGIVKSGRTHLQDAVPISFSQEISGWRSSLEADRELIRASIPPLSSLALGGTAVGTGLNAPKGFDTESAKAVSELTGKPFRTAENKYHALTSKSELVYSHGALKGLAADLMKIANDIRWLSSGPRCGLGEIFIPENEPGSSIMPGKVNPVICEATIMVAAQVIGNDATIALSSTNGAFELNVGIPVMAANLLQSIRLLANVSRVSAEKMIDGLTANVDRCRFLAEASPSTVTPLNKLIGYEAAAKIAKYSVAHKVTVREAVVALGYVERGEVTEEQLDAALDVTKMLGNF